MRYYTDLFSPETYEAFSTSPRDVSGFRVTQAKQVEKLKVGDKLVCYMTKLSRWVGILEVLSSAYQDNQPIFVAADDPFVVRVRVRPIVWLAKDKTVPIHEPEVWGELSFTKGLDRSSPGWTGKIRRSLHPLAENDGLHLERLLLGQQSGGTDYPVDPDEYQSLLAKVVRRPDKPVVVTVPADRVEEDRAETSSPRESIRVQAMLANIGERMGFRIWIPRPDRAAVLSEWEPRDGALLEELPLSYDETTIRTVERIDCLWLRGRAMARAFEVEHTTAVYSGILRMADLLALQPNMDIRLHIVAPDYRKQKVFDEIRRPVFSLLEKGPLADSCTFISYESLHELAELQFLEHMSPNVLDEYGEEAE